MVTPIDRTDPWQSETITLEFDLDHAPAKVWCALTDPELLEEWLLPVVGLELEAGVTFTFQAEPQPGWDGVVECRLLEIEPKRRLRYAWIVGDPESDFFLDTEVTFTLTPTESGTRLSLVHTGFEPDQKENFAGARYGWKMMGRKLVDLLEETP